jgi:DNA-binding NarL/FixJ family response regulator
MRISILLADDHDLFRECLRSRMEKEPRFSLLAEACDGRDAARLALQLAPDITLLDLYMPGTNGLEAAAGIRAHNRSAKIIALSSCTDQRSIARMKAAGAAAYLCKSCPFHELCRAIDAVHRNQPYRRPCSTPLTGEPTRANAGQLSVREQETLDLLAQGKSSQDIADQMCVCLKTVEVHRHHLRQKLGVSSIAELTRYALQQACPIPKIENSATLRVIPNGCFPHGFVS